jgi:hypothetical protein
MDKHIKKEYYSGEMLHMDMSASKYWHDCITQLRIKVVVAINPGNTPLRCGSGAGLGGGAVFDSNWFQVSIESNSHGDINYSAAVNSKLYDDRCY